MLGLPGVAHADEPNTTCRIDAVAERGGVVSTVTCLQLDTEQYGEMNGAVTVTLQALRSSKWVDVASQRCTDTSTKGVLELRCAVSDSSTATQTVRGLVDLDKPKDWGPAIVQPRYLGRDPNSDAQARDDCELNELTDGEDLTGPDAPWADLCAVYVGSSVRDGNVAITMAIDVLGGLEQRAGAATWSGTLEVGGCQHEFTVFDAGDSDKLSSLVDSYCQYEPGECGPILSTVYDLIWGSCSTNGTWKHTEQVKLPASAVHLTDTEVILRFAPAQVSSLLGRELVPGATIRAVYGRTSVGASTGGDTPVYTAFDGDYASSTGKTHTIR